MEKYSTKVRVEFLSRYREWNIGDEADLHRNQAKLLVLTKRARYATAAVVAEPAEVVPEAAPEVTPDAVTEWLDNLADEALPEAEQDGEPAEEPAEAVEISPRTGRPKRPYRRRDMTAE